MVDLATPRLAVIVTDACTHVEVGRRIAFLMDQHNAAVTDLNKVTVCLTESEYAGAANVPPYRTEVCPGPTPINGIGKQNPFPIHTPIVISLRLPQLLRFKSRLLSMPPGLIS
jgi:hypothetical protein